MPPRPGYRWFDRRSQIRAVARGGERTVAEIAEAIGVSRRAAQEHMDKMRRDGLATQHRPHGERAARWRVR